MAEQWICVSVIMVFAICLQLPGSVSKEEKVLYPCKGRQVCTTLMKYKDGTVTDEGDYCECGEGGICSKEWEESHGAYISWQHYERAHWNVQYKLCRPLFVDKPQCQGDEMGAQVETAVTEWAPHLTQPRCVCPDGSNYKINGWKRVGAVWQYYYNCKKDDCPSPSADQEEAAECARIYVDAGKKSDKVLEMKFHCSCPEGFLCPAKYNDKADDSSIQSDEDGRSFVPKYCETVVKRKRSS